jgi:hypothetical protein
VLLADAQTGSAATRALNKRSAVVPFKSGVLLGRARPVLHSALADAHHAKPVALAVMRVIVGELGDAGAERTRK